jgi:hypothetical protein
MTDYYRIRRQLFALLIGALFAAPIAIIAAVFTPSHAPSMNIGSAGHTAYGPFLLAFFAALHVASFFATALNYFFGVVACFVAGSLVLDVYKLRGWRTSKSFALCIGVLSFLSTWYGIATYAKNDLLLSSLAPFLSSSIGLVLIGITLVALRKLGTNGPDEAAMHTSNSSFNADASRRST